MFRKFHVKKDERALLFWKGDFADILRPGEYVRFDPLRRLEMEKFALAKTRFEHRLGDFLVKAEPELVAREFHVVELGATEVGLRYENGVLAEVLAPNTRRLYWKGYVDLAFERIDIATDYAVDAKQVPQLIAAITRGTVKIGGHEGVLAALVPQYHAGVLYVDGKVAKLLDAGIHFFWKFLRELRVETVDLRLQVIEVAGEGKLNKNKETPRVELNTDNT